LSRGIALERTVFAGTASMLRPREEVTGFPCGHSMEQVVVPATPAL